MNVIDVFTAARRHLSLCLSVRGDVSNQWPASSGLSLSQMSRDEKHGVSGPSSGLSSGKEEHGRVLVRCQ